MKNKLYYNKIYHNIFHNNKTLRTIFFVLEPVVLEPCASRFQLSRWHILKQRCDPGLGVHESKSSMVFVKKNMKRDPQTL